MQSTVPIVPQRVISPHTSENLTLFFFTLGESIQDSFVSIYWMYLQVNIDQFNISHVATGRKTQFCSVLILPTYSSILGSFLTHQRQQQKGKQTVHPFIYVLIHVVNPFLVFERTVIP